jgi:predicted AlkP superfamily pyrophosphatase or phosphodiesterase
VILISIDGFAYDYLNKYQPKNLLSLANTGVTAKGMQPIFPSKTFPNHLSIVTGVYPAKHGIVHNKFFHRKLNKEYSLGAGNIEPSWLTAKPIWTLAEEQGLKSAIYFWPESETTVEGVLPSYYFPYVHNTPNIKRVNQIVNWLKLPSGQRPDFIASYFSTIDSIGHKHGRGSIELQKAIDEIDLLLGTLINKISSETTLTPNFVIVSDHGMTSIEKGAAIEWKNIFSNFENINVINGQTQLYIYEKNQNILNDVRSQLSNNKQLIIYSKGEFPKHWHFNIDNFVIPDMIIEAIPPFTFSNGYTASATHGYDPLNKPDLSAIFIAQGPNFKKNITIEPFENIHVFSLLEGLLQLSPSKNIDSNVNVLSKILLPHK